MKLEKSIEIDILEFFKSGKFDYIKLGQTKEWILNNFPDPDTRFDSDWVKERDVDIWTYGNIEFHFSGENLYLIFSDNFSFMDKLTGGNSLKLNRWIFEDASKLNLIFVLKELNSNGIDYKKRMDKLGVCVRLNSGIELTFENRDDIEDLNPNEFIMSSFSKIDENPIQWKT